MNRGPTWEMKLIVRPPEGSPLVQQKGEVVVVAAPLVTHNHCSEELT
jgi:hypothetical protein